MEAVHHLRNLCSMFGYEVCGQQSEQSGKQRRIPLFVNLQYEIREPSGKGPVLFQTLDVQQPVPMIYDAIPGRHSYSRHPDQQHQQADRA
jgi:hypothetical protein